MDVEKILRWMYRIFKFLCKLGFFWAMLGGFFYWISATNGHNLGALYEFFWLWVVAVGGTFLHFYNRIMSRIKHRKVNLVLDVLKAVFGGRVKLPEGVKAKLDTYKEPFGVIYGKTNTISRQRTHRGAWLYSVLPALESHRGYLSLPCFPMALNRSIRASQSNLVYLW